MRYHPAQRSGCFTWRSFDRRNGRRIDEQLRAVRPPCCPQCGVLLEAQPMTRFRQCLVLDCTGYDLDCRDCRRFWSVIRHTPRSLRLLRMRRLAAAVRAAGRPSRPGREWEVADAGYSAVA